MELGYLIKKIREKKKLSQQEIANLMDISQKTYSNFESCKSKLSFVQLCELSKILKFDLLNLLDQLGITFYNDDSNDTFNKTSKKDVEKILNNLIKKYEYQIKDRDELIELLKKKIQLISEDTTIVNLI